MDKRRTYTDEHGTLHTETGAKPLPIYYDWQAELPADPWRKRAGWRRVGYKMTWQQAKAYAREHGIDFDTQMRNDEASAEFRRDVDGRQNGPVGQPRRGGTL